MKRKIARVCLGLLLTLSLVVPAMARELVIVAAEEIENTDIQQCTTSFATHDFLYAPMLVLDSDMTLQKGYVSDWKVSEDGMVITMTIPEGLKFSNGDPVTAEAVMRSFVRYAETSSFGADFKKDCSFSVNGNDFIMTWTDSPAANFVDMASAFTGLVDVAAAERTDKDEFARKAVTFGLFAVDEWVQGSHIILKRNPYHRTNIPFVENKGIALVESVRVRFVPSGFTRVSEIQAGKADIAFNIPIENVDELEKNDNVEMIRYLLAGGSMYYLNDKVPGLNDPAVRQAIIRGIDKEELVAVLDDKAQARYGFMPPTMSGYSEAAEEAFSRDFGYDMEKAKGLLETAGWKAGKDGIREKDGVRLSFTMMVPLDIPEMASTAPLIQAQLKKLGIAVEIREFEHNYVKNQTRKGEYEIAGRRYNWPDGSMVNYLFESTYKYTSDPEVDEVLKVAVNETNPAKRMELYAKGQRLVLEKGLGVPLLTPFRYLAFSKQIKGYKMTGNTILLLNDVEFVK
ncbi:ABC transporter substrate-binding protein [Aminiphilus circumscriptus]|uniref:ABC transporter substrate-binding protein n=1 Tax=Aminiphilus circumscriptus TaxID=290732 RepID=UPI0012F80C7E|nr:ABC transporter substrate-binding protein [Aminiphilus circumscriptus]